jgi:hypothetical protein
MVSFFYSFSQSSSIITATTSSFFAFCSMLMFSPHNYYHRVLDHASFILSMVHAYDETNRRKTSWYVEQNKNVGWFSWCDGMYGATIYQTG